MPRDLLEQMEFQALWDPLVLVSLDLWVLLGLKDRLDYLEPEGCRVKRDLRERRVSRGSAPAPPEETPSSQACRDLRGFRDHQDPLEYLDCRVCLGTTAFRDSQEWERSWNPYPLSGSSLRPFAGTVPRARQLTQWHSWKKDRRETRAFLACQVLTTVLGASLSRSARGQRRPGETAMEIRAVLGAQACLVPRACQAKGEKRVHLA